MHQVDKHSEMLYEMDTKMLIMNNTLQQLMWTIDAIRFESNMLHYFQTRIYRVHNFLYALQGDTESLFELYESFSFSRIKSNDYPPNVLKTILHKIEEDINSHARLKLCEIKLP